MQTILDLSHDQARDFFLEGDNYASIDFPDYFSFDLLLAKISNKLGTSGKASDYFNSTRLPDGKTKLLKPSDFSDVNYNLISNKDGNFAWRHLEIIHPVLYVDLAHLITTEQNWGLLQKRFAKYKKTSVVCESIPVVPSAGKSQKATQVSKWWNSIEQASIKKGLEYQYVFDVDISDCYGAIYTHSIAWALHGKMVMKNNRKSNHLGNKIDQAISSMRYGQTNGIPQGSVLMDFIAEIVIGYADEELNKLIKGIKEEFSIIRYRDDYKIFTNNPEVGREIVKYLSQVMSSLGMKLNTQKTKLNSDPILASVKQDKLAGLLVPKIAFDEYTSISKWLLRTYTTVEKYPGGTDALKELTRIYKALNKTKKLNDYDDVHVMISLATNIAIKNPKAYPWTMAIISKLLEFCTHEDKIYFISLIRKKFDRLPNSGLVDIWLQRVSYKIDSSIEYPEKITKLLSSNLPAGNILWHSSWLTTQMQDLLDTPIINKATIKKMKTAITAEEVMLFKPVRNS